MLDQCVHFLIDFLLCVLVISVLNEISLKCASLSHVCKITSRHREEVDGD